MARKYVIIDNSVDINFDEVEETSTDTLRWNNDNTKTFVKYEGYKPLCLYGKLTYSYNQMLTLLNDVDGEWYIEDTTSE